jgi:hypothetical protein
LVGYGLLVIGRGLWFDNAANEPVYKLLFFNYFILIHFYSTLTGLFEYFCYHTPGVAQGYNIAASRQKSSGQVFRLLLQMKIHSYLPTFHPVLLIDF